MSHSYDGSNAGGVPVYSPWASASLMIEENSQIGEGRRVALSLAERVGFGAVEQSNLAIVVTEVINNIIRHAGRGELLLRGFTQGTVGGIDLLALDRGSGMESISQCMEDGFSTAGTPGTGLGAIHRLSSSLDIYSRPGLGTALHSCSLAKTRQTSDAPSALLGIVSRPKLGQDVCGDGWAVVDEPTRRLFLLVDGLGHGPDAAQASRVAAETFHQQRAHTPGVLLEHIHSAMQGTRGAAIAVAEVDGNKQEVRFAGIGNISGVIVHDELSSSMVSHYGIIGYQMRKVQEFTYPCRAGSLLVLCSDGISTGMSFVPYPGLLWQHPALIAGVLYRDFQRTNDDATILVARALPVGQGSS